MVQFILLLSVGITEVHGLPKNSVLHLLEMFAKVLQQVFKQNIAVFSPGFQCRKMPNFSF